MAIRSVTGAALFAAALTLGAAWAGTPAFAQATFESERAQHPRLAAALRDLVDAETYLNHAPDDFGGRKAQAIEDIHRAIRSLKRALYFRLKLDDAAIDRAP